MTLEPRDASSLDYITLWDEGCVKTRRNQLVQGLISKLALEQTHREALQARKEFRTYEGFKLPKGKNLEETFGEQARKEAEKILEQERKNYIDARAERDKSLIVEIARKMRFSTWIVNEKGDPEKLKVIVEHVTKKNHKGDSITRDVQYVADHDFDRLRQINSLLDRLLQLRPYFPYYPEEIQKLYEEALELGTLEYVRKEKKKKTEKVKT